MTRTQADIHARRSSLKRAEIARAIKAAQDAGLVVGQVEISSAGTIIVRTGTTANHPTNELDRWIESHANPPQRAK